MMIVSLLRVAATICLAWLVGKLASRVKLPAILGWLIAGMALGPHALGLLDGVTLNTVWFQGSVHVLECGVGLMIGTEIIWRSIKRTGSQIIVTTLTESIGTFVVVTATFAVVASA